MAKRARYDGPHRDGVLVYDPEDVYLARPLAVVKPGQMLPTEADDGTAIPASLRDELLAREDWSEVQDSSGSTATKTKES